MFNGTWDLEKYFRKHESLRDEVIEEKEARFAEWIFFKLKEVPKHAKKSCFCCCWIKIEFNCEMNFGTSFNYLCEKAISFAKYVSNRTCWNEFSRLNKNASKKLCKKIFRLSFALNFSVLALLVRQTWKKIKKKFFMTKKPQKWQLKFSSLLMLLCWYWNRHSEVQTILSWLSIRDI